MIDVATTPKRRPLFLQRTESSAYESLLVVAIRYSRQDRAVFCSRSAITRLREAADIEEPIERETRSALHLDQDRKGISGSPDLARVILEKIEQAVVFVGDVTPVGTVPDNEPGAVAKRIMNPNVAIELGYALHALTDRALLMVLNEHYGSRADLLFDLQSKAGPIMFRLSPDADKDTIAAEARQLTGHFVEALRPYIEQQVQHERLQRPFPAAEAKDGLARFRARNEALGIRERAGNLDPGGGSILLAPGPAIWLRLMPSVDPGKKWTIQELSTALSKGINLPTIVNPVFGTYTIRADDGVGTILLADGMQTPSVAFAFKTGEIWAIDTWILSAEQSMLLTVEIEQALTDRLRRYGQVLSLLGLPPPYRWIAGITGATGRQLQFPPAGHQIRVPGFSGPLCASDNIGSEEMYDGSSSPMTALLPFFKEIFDSCGIERPEHLPQS
jgi:hypothetical protein